MKKTLIALAALGAVAGAAQAQSAVTLYGVADAYFGQTSKTTRDAAGVETKLKQTVVNSGGVNGSRWGLKGSEDLGGGLKAIFQLESGFNIDDSKGSTDGLFNRQAFVGLSGGFGAVTLGRQYTAYDGLRGATNNTLDTSFATTGAAWANGVADYSGRTNNSIAYTSPSFGGVSGAVVLGLGEDKTAALSATKNNSLRVQYANGPVLVGYAFQVENSRIAATTAPVAAASNTANIKYNLLAGSYDFGVAKLTGGYNTAKQATLKDKEFQLGVSVPFGAATLAAGYARSKSNAAVSTKGTGYSLLGTYDLSKRTRLYAGLNKTKNESAAVTTGSYKTSVIATGIRHSF